MQIRSLSRAGIRPIPNFGPQIKRKKVAAIGPVLVRFSLNGQGGAKRRFRDDSDAAAKWLISRLFNFCLDIMKEFISAFMGQKGGQFGGNDPPGSPLSCVHGGSEFFSPNGNNLGKGSAKRKFPDGGGMPVKYLFPMALSFLKNIVKMFMSAFSGRKENPFANENLSSGKLSLIPDKTVPPGSSSGSAFTSLF